MAVAWYSENPPVLQRRGCINSELKLSDRIWTCDCGAVLDRDLNAALNLRSLAVRAVRPEQAERRTLAESDVRPVAVQAASLKQEPSIESRSRF